MKKGERKIREEDLKKAIEENGGCANANVLLEVLEKRGIKTTFVTIQKRAIEMADEGVLIDIGYMTGKGQRKGIWRVKGNDDEFEGHR